MSTGIVAMMLGASIILGAFGLWALLWGIKTGQFEDSKKFLDGALYDGEDALQDAIKLEKRKRDIIEKRKRNKEGYRPPD